MTIYRIYSMLLLISLTSPVVNAGLLTVPGGWVEGPSGYLTPTQMNGTVELPDYLYNRVMKKNEQSWELHIRSDASYAPYVNSRDADISFARAYDCSKGCLGEALQQGMYLTTGRVTANRAWEGHPEITASCLIYVLTRYNTTGAQWVSGCIPIDWTPAASCEILTTDVMLDHGTVSMGAPSIASAPLEVQCTIPANGRLSLPDRGSSIPVGGGTASLSAGGAPLGSPLRFETGVSTLTVTSVLNDVAAGGWSSSLPLVLELD